MISHKILTRKDVGDLSKYYEDGVDDYYSKEVDASQWQGKGAASLHLTGEIKQADFTRLLTGEVVGDEVRSSSVRLDSDKRLGIDLTFSAPKSISLQALVHGDVELIKAHDRAVATVLERIEGLAEARRKEKGVSYVENTGNLIVAKFRHETNRETDPQLHTHAVVLNLTQRSDGAWRTLKNDNIIKNSKYYGALYRSELANECQKLGYGIRLENNGLFELAHISRDQISAFSQRSSQVEAYLNKRGLDRETATTGQKQTAALNTRKSKGETDRDELHQEWRSKAQELGMSFEKMTPAPATAQPDMKDMQESATEKSLDFAIRHLSERQSVFSQMELMNAMLQHGVGTVTQASVDKEISKRLEGGELHRGEQRYLTAQNKDGQSLTKQQWIAFTEQKGMSAEVAPRYVTEAIQQGRLVPDVVQFTTREALIQERELLAVESAGRQSVAPIMEKKQVDADLAEVTLSKGQRQAVESMITGENRITGIQGLAGTGKSHMLQAAQPLIEKSGFEIKTIAPYGAQVKALKELNMPAQTLAAFLHREDKEISSKTVLVLDEAGVVPARQMHELLKLVEAHQARIVLLGDTKQTKAIEAGRPFDQLQRNGMTTIVMDEIQRQKDKDLKQAVEFAAKGESAKSLSKISAVVEIKDDAERRMTIAQNYTQLAPQEREKTIIVSGTNESRKEINENVRQLLDLHGKGKELETLERRDNTKAERLYAKNFHYNDIIRFDTNYKRLDLSKGDLYQVIDKFGDNLLKLRSVKTGLEIDVDPAAYNKISVYEQVKKEFSVGDAVRITHNMPDYGVTNGDRFKVSKLADGEIEISNARHNVALNAKDFLHLDHAYATTVHSSQGLTADRVMYDAKTSSRTTSKDVYYVAISRARHQAEIYTENREKLPVAIARVNEKSAALDLEVKSPQLEKSNLPVKDHGVQMERG